MARERILVVTTEPPDEAQLAPRLRDEIPEGAEVRVVSPATKVSPLDWLTGAEDDARAAAAEADEIVVMTGSGGDDTWLEEEAVREALAAPGVPVRRIEG
jgi:hypothetical protein